MDGKGVVDLPQSYVHKELGSVEQDPHFVNGLIDHQAKDDLPDRESHSHFFCSIHHLIKLLFLHLSQLWAHNDWYEIKLFLLNLLKGFGIDNELWSK